MPARARYDGGHTAVIVRVNPGEQPPRFVTVEQGHQLPAEDESGEAIPAALRDELLKTDQWSEVDQRSSTAKDKE